MTRRMNFLRFATIIALLVSEAAWPAKKLPTFSSVVDDSVSDQGNEAPQFTEIVLSPREAQLEKEAEEAEKASKKRRKPTKLPTRVVSTNRHAPAKAKAKAKKSAPSPAAAKSTVSGFDPIPMNQNTAVQIRLRLVEELASKYGRAYDYRTYTVSQLQKILADLDAKRTAAVVAPVMGPAPQPKLQPIPQEELPPPPPPEVVVE